MVAKLSAGKGKTMTPKIKDDPELKRQQTAARLEKVQTMQERLATETDQSLRYYGSRRALSGASGVPSLAGM